MFKKRGKILFNKTTLGFLKLAQCLFVRNTNCLLQSQVWSFIYLSDMLCATTNAQHNGFIQSGLKNQLDIQKFEKLTFIKRVFIDNLGCLLFVV